MKKFWKLSIARSERKYSKKSSYLYFLTFQSVAKNARNMMEDFYFLGFYSQIWLNLCRG